MNDIDIGSFFEKHEDEYSKFERIESPAHARPDICAFLLLARLDESNRDMVAAAERDEIFLAPDPESVFIVATEEELLTLIRCGVRYDDELDSFAMYV